MSGYHVESCIVEQLDGIGSRHLIYNRVSDCSCFKSWSRIGTWLQQVVIELQARFIRDFLDEFNG